MPGSALKKGVRNICQSRRRPQGRSDSTFL